MRDKDLKKLLKSLLTEDRQDDFLNIRADKKNAAFHITITNNSTGEKFVDCDTCCIIGSYDAGDKGTGAMVFSVSDNTELAAATRSAQKAIKHVLDNNPMIRLLCAIAEKKE